MSLIPERLSRDTGRTFAAIGIDRDYPPVRLRPEGGIDFDYYLARSRAFRSESYAVALRALGRGLRAALIGWVKAVRAWRARDRALAELLSLDDRALRDIGLNRAGVYFAVEHGREDVPAPANINAVEARSHRAA